MAAADTRQLPRSIRSSLKPTEQVLTHIHSLSPDHQGLTHLVLTDEHLIIKEVRLFGPSRDQVVHTFPLSEILTFDLHRGPFAWGLKREWSAIVDTSSGSHFELSHLTHADAVAVQSALGELSENLGNQ